MRRSLLGLLTVAAITGLLIMSGCQQSSVFRVVQVNNGRTLEADVADFGVFKDPGDPEAEPFLTYTIQRDTVEIELEYVEAGAGLPTVAPYEAVINQATITYTSLLDPETTYDPAIIPLTVRVQSDLTGKKTTKFMLTVVPVWWKEQYFDVNDPPEYDLQDVIEATIKFTGRDPVARHDVEATATLHMEIGNFYDNEQSFGKSDLSGRLKTPAPGLILGIA